MSQPEISRNNDPRVAFLSTAAETPSCGLYRSRLAGDRNIDKQGKRETLLTDLVSEASLLMITRGVKRYS